MASKEQLGSMEVIGCLDNLRRNSAMGSTLKTKSGVFRRAIKDLEAPGPPSSVSEGICRMSGGISGGSGHSVVGLVQEEGGTSFVEESVERWSPVVGAGDDAMMVLERKQEELGAFVEESRVPIEFKATSVNGPDRTGVVQDGLSLEPKMKEVKPGLERALCLGENSGSFHEGPKEIIGSGLFPELRATEIAQATGLDGEGIAPETVQGSNDLQVSGRHREEISPELAQGPKVVCAGFHRSYGRSSPEVAQTGSMGVFRSGHGEQASKEGHVKALILWGGF